MTRVSATSFDRTLLSAALITAFAAAVPAAAGEAADRPSVRVAIDSRVRVERVDHGGVALVGRVRSIDDETLTIETSGGSTVRTARADVGRIQISVETRRTTTKGALVGAASGAALGALLGAGACGGSNDDCTRAEGALILGGLFVPGGALWGGVVGHFKVNDRWATVPTSDVFSRSQSNPSPERDEYSQGPPLPVALAAADVAPPPAFRGTNPALFQGGRVRVLHGGSKTHGLLAGVSDDAVTVATSAGSLAIRRDSIERIDTFGGEKKQIVKGALIGLVSGAALDFTSEPYCASGSYDERACSRFASASETALGGAIVGAVIGLLVKKTTWIPTRIDDLEPTPRSTSGVDVLVSPILSHSKGAGLKIQLAW